MEPKVKSIHVQPGAVVVGFTDGHKATFVENSGGWGASTSLERILLETDGKVVALFHSMHQHPVRRTPFGITQLAEGYTVERVTAYWRTAYDYVAAGFRSGQLTDAWLTVHHGMKDIKELEGNVWPAPRR